MKLSAASNALNLLFPLLKLSSVRAFSTANTISVEQLFKQRQEFDLLKKQLYTINNTGS